jgi:hypothetical protein
MAGDFNKGGGSVGSTVLGILGALFLIGIFFSFINWVSTVERTDDAPPVDAFISLFILAILCFYGASRLQKRSAKKTQAREASSSAERSAVATQRVALVLATMEPGVREVVERMVPKPVPDGQLWAFIKVGTDPVGAHVYGMNGQYWGETGGAGDGSVYRILPMAGAVAEQDDEGATKAAAGNQFSVTAKKRGYATTKHDFLLHTSSDLASVLANPDVVLIVLDTPTMDI